MVVICKNNRPAALEHTGMSCTFPNTHCFGLTGCHGVVVFLDFIINIILTIQKLCFLASSGGSLGRLAIIGNVSVLERER